MKLIIAYAILFMVLVSGIDSTKLSENINLSTNLSTNNNKRIEITSVKKVSVQNRKDDAEERRKKEEEKKKKEEEEKKKKEEEEKRKKEQEELMKSFWPYWYSYSPFANGWYDNLYWGNYGWWGYGYGYGYGYDYYGYMDSLGWSDYGYGGYDGYGGDWGSMDSYGYGGDGGFDGGYGGGFDGGFGGDGGYGGFDRVYAPYLRKSFRAEREKIMKERKNNDGKKTDVKEQPKTEKIPPSDVFKKLRSMPLKEQREAAKKELKKLKFEVFGDTNFDTAKFREEHKTEVYSTKWILKQMAIVKLARMEKRLEKVIALKK